MANFTGGPGNDTFTGDDADNGASGGGGDDILIGLGGNDWLYGDADNDQLSGGAGDDMLYGDSGDDVLEGGIGTDRLEGGTGTDTASYANATGAVTATLLSNRSSGADGADTLVAIENLIGSGFADWLMGDDGVNAIEGGGGIDVLQGNGGNDRLDGGAGDDIMDGGAGDDTFIADSFGDQFIEAAGGGTDTIVSSASMAFLPREVEILIVRVGPVGQPLRQGIGNALNNVLTGVDAVGSTGVNLFGDAGNDSIYGSSGDDFLIGGADNDLLDGGAGQDMMAGGTGDDTYVVDMLNDGVSEQAGEGRDTVRTALGAYVLGANLEQLIYSGTGGFVGIGNAEFNTIDARAATAHVSLSGLGGTDVLYGGAGLDTLDGGSGNDIMYGGAGNDLYVVDSSLDQIIELAGGGTDTVESSSSFTLGSEVENLVVRAGAAGQPLRVGTGNALENVLTGISIVGSAGVALSGEAGSDIINGSSSDDLLWGGSDNDIVRGGDGNDSLNGGSGDDELHGGAGDDRYAVDSSGDQVVEVAGEGIDTVDSSISYTLGAHVENLTIGSAGADQPFNEGNGNELDNVLTGVNAAGYYGLSLNGAGGNDTIYGSSGTDWINGGDGDDIIYAGNGFNMIAGGAGNDQMHGGAEFDEFFVHDAGDMVFDTADGDNDLIDVYTSSWVLTAGAKVGQIWALGGFGDTTVTVSGNELGQRIDGFAQINILNGMAGNDEIHGGSGNDELSGGADDDAVYGGAGEDTLNGDHGNDTLYGEADADTLNGSMGNDTLEGGAGTDTMDGGTGDDVFLVDDAGDFAFEAPGEGDDRVFASVSWTMTADQEIELLATSNAAGTDAIDLTGNDLANRIEGNAGENILAGASGADALNGAGGNDLLDGGAGADTMDGGIGDDRFLVDNAFDFAFEAPGAGNDRVEASVSWTMTAGQEIETLTTTNAAGTDAIDLTGNEFANRITGNAGNNILQGNDGDDFLFGLAGHDALTGGLGKDTLEGGIGRDWLDGGAGQDMMSGGADDDTYVVDTALDVVLELAGEGNDTVRTTLSSYTLKANVENLVYFGSGGFAGTGNELANIIDTRSVNGNDTLKGLAGADTLYSGAGNDSLDGGTGVDSMNGGGGDDSYYVDDAADQAIELSGEGNDTVRSSLASYALGANIETLVLAGAGKNGTGNALDNVLIGTGGHNILDGGAGADRMEGGTGDDTYYIDNANDLIVETGVGIDKAIASVGYTLRAGVSVETLTTDNDGGTAAINLTGNELANRVVGNAGANTLHGGGGNDRLEGLDGGDTLWGDAGTDLLIGGNGNDLYVVTDLGDTILETATGGVDRVSLSLATGGTFTLGSYVETLIVAGSGIEAHGNAQDNQIVNSATNSSLWGEGGNDKLIGSTGIDLLHGGTGNDRITGGAGNDTMWGDAGNDLFVFASGSGADEVVDFVRGADKIDLAGYGITSFAQVEAMLSQSGADAVIDLGGGNSITLDNIVGSQLTASDFAFGF